MKEIAMNSKVVCIVAGLLAAIGFASDVHAQSAPASAPAGVSAAVLDFEGQLPGNTSIGQQVSDILSVRLSMIEGLTLVERGNLGKVLDEHKLKLAGLVDASQSAQVGKLIGAKLLVMGKVAMIGDKLTIIVKVVGVETSVMKGVIITVEKDKELSDALAELSEKVSALIIRESANLLPKGQAVSDPIPELKKSLEKKYGSKAPSLAVVVPERHVDRVIADPAATTEIKRVLVEVGFTVLTVEKSDLGDWAKKNVKAQSVSWPDGMEKADYAVFGEGVSQSGGRTGDLVTCVARVEIALARRSDGKVLLSDSDTVRGVDLAETIAAKTSLQGCGYKLGLAVARKLVEVEKEK